MNKPHEKRTERNDSEKTFSDATASFTNSQDDLKERVGPYKLLSILGQGGCGVVYLAEQEKPVKRRVALKIIKPGMDTKEVIARFEAERQALALLDHPNIAQVYDAGTTEKARPYFVMEHVKGVPINEHCDRQKLSIEDRLWLFLQVCDAIQYAHQKGIIHRDIKPSNILVMFEGQKAIPKVIDFGVAKAISQSLTERTLFTEQGQLLGTPEYMSPEQAEMTKQDIDTRSDIYSLGVVLYELLAGALPFDPKTLREAGIDSMRRVIREQDPPRPSTRLTSLGEEATRAATSRRTEVRTLARRLHKELEWIPLKAMRKERTHRYRSASEFADDIQNYLNGDPLIAGPESVMYRVSKFVRKRRGAVAAAAIAVASLLVGFVVSTGMYFRAEGLRVQAERACEKEAAARAAAEQAEKVAQQQRVEAEEQAEARRRALYFNRITLAEATYRDGNIRSVLELLLSCPADLRGWEWYRLWNVANQARQTLRGHSSEVSSVAFSPSGKQVASGSYDQTVRIWDVETGTQITTLKGHQEAVWPVAFSPDGKRLASGSYDKTIKIWDTESGTEIKTLGGHQDAVMSIVFSPDGRQIISGSFDKMIKVWDVASGAEIKTLGRHEGGIWSVACSPDGKQIASGGTDDTVRVWDADSGQEKLTLEGHEDCVNTVAFSPDGGRLVSGSDDETIKVWNATDGSEIKTLKGHDGLVWSVSFSPDANQVVSASADGSVRVWDAASGEEVKVFRGHEGAVYSVALGPDGKQIVSGGEDGTIRLWEAEGVGEVLTLRGHKSPVLPTAFSPDGRLIASGDYGATIKVWDVVDRTVRLTLKRHKGAVLCLAFSPDGRRIASGSTDRTAKVWNVADGNEVMTLQGHSDAIYSVRFSPDGTRIVSGSLDGTIRIWDAQDGTEEMSLKSDRYGVIAVALSPDGKWMASAGSGRDITIWDASSGKQVRSIRTGLSSPYSIAFSPDGKYVASANYDKTITVWDAANVVNVMTLRGHGAAVLSVGFSPDGERIISASSDKTVKLWDTASGAEVMTLRGHDGQVLSASFSPDGRRIVSGSADQTVRVWDAADPKAVATQIPVLARLGGPAEGKMVAWWRLDEIEGPVVADSSESGIDGKLVGDARWRPGRVQGALEFDGDGDYVDCGADPVLDIGGLFTVAAWVKVNTFDKPFQAIVTKGDTAWRLHRYSETDSIEFHIANWAFSPSAGAVGNVGVNDGRWHHVAGVFDGGKVCLYVDGMLDVATAVSPLDAVGINTQPVYIGENSERMGRGWNGLIDEVRIYDYALSQAEINSLMGPWPEAHYPVPSDGVVNVAVPVLQWTAGDSVAWHDVYLGTDSALGQSELKSRQEGSTCTYAARLAPNTTYYWRVDEVEDDGATVHAGDVWSFTTSPSIAYGARPSDGAEYVDCNTVLAWSMGFAAASHEVYLGTDRGEVDGGSEKVFRISRAETSWGPGSLEPGVTYYWRVDEVDVDGTSRHKGPVWSFTTVPDIAVTDPNLLAWWRFDEGTGSKALDWSGHNHHGQFVGEPEWVNGRVGGALQFGGEGDYVNCGDLRLDGADKITVSAWIRVNKFDKNWQAIVTKGDTAWRLARELDTNGVQFWVTAGGMPGVRGSTDVNDGEWHHLCGTYDEANIRLYVDGLEDRGSPVAYNGGIGTNTQPVYIGENSERMGRGWNGLIDEVRIYDYALSQAEIDNLMGPWLKAHRPVPGDGAVGVAISVLEWRAGDSVAWHDVYLGTDSALGQSELKGRQESSTCTYSTRLAPNTAYYWRVDEVEGNGVTVHTGDVWSFATAPTTAYGPRPSDGAEYVDCNTILAWSMGFAAASHEVYLGTDRGKVDGGSGDVFRTCRVETSWGPGSLEPGVTYYWRVDEVDADRTGRHKGPVWSFTTAPHIAVTDPNLVGWWRFDEGSGATALDWSGRRNHGQLVGEPNWVTGRVGSCLEFDGNKSQVEVHGFDLTMSAVTFVAWIEGWKGTDWAGVVFSRVGEVACGMHFGDDKRLHYTWNDNDEATYSWAGGPVIPKDEWSMVAVAIEPSKAAAYVWTEANRLQKGLHQIEHKAQKINGLIIGRDEHPRFPARYFHGLIDEVRIYDYALSEAEIEELCAKGG